MNARSIIGLPVETEQGTHLGAVLDIALDPEQRQILYYSIAPSSLVSRMLSKHSEQLLIHPTQVVAIQPEKMIVRELTGNDNAYAYDISPRPIQPSPIN